jgi:hypothetical protein
MQYLSFWNCLVFLFCPFPPFSLPLSTFPFLPPPHHSLQCPYLLQVIVYSSKYSLLYQLYSLLPSILSLYNPWQKHPPPWQPNYILTNIGALLPISPHLILIPFCTPFFLSALPSTISFFKYIFYSYVHTMFG